MNYDFNKITDHYENLTPLIFAQAEKNKRFWVSPYSRYIDWVSMFSPIEMQTWFALRGFGHCPLYPQYPVGRYFTDFGNPVVRVALECDGKEWHINKNKDKIRDYVFENKGWSTYRISGSDCFKIEERYDDLDYLDESETFEVLSNFYNNTVEGLIKAIAMFHFRYKTYNKYINEYELAFNCLIKRCSILSEKIIQDFYNIVAEEINNIPEILKSKTEWLR